MKLQLNHPKPLVVVLLTIASVTAVGLLFACGGDDKESTFTPIPVARTLPTVSDEELLFASGGDDKVSTVTHIPVENTRPTVSDEELVEAIRVAKASGVIEKINDGQGWTHDFVYADKINGVKVVSFDATWETTVESSGPWALHKCKNTRKLMLYARWTNINRLAVTVDIEGDELIAYAPMGDDGDEPVLEVGSHGDKEATVYDTASGDIVFEGTKKKLSGFRMCPSGKEEEQGK